MNHSHRARHIRYVTAVPPACHRRTHLARRPWAAIRICRPRTAARGMVFPLICRAIMALRGFVWVAASANRVATVYTNAPKQLRETIFVDLCTLFCTPPRPLARPGGATGPTTSATPWPRDARALGPDTYAARAVTQPLTHTNSRSLVKQRLIARHIRGNTIPLAAVRGLHVRMAAQGLRQDESCDGKQGEHGGHVADMTGTM